MDQPLRNEIISNWQNIADLLAELLQVTTALITNINDKQFEVIISSQSNGNPISAGDKFELKELFCEQVIKNQHKLNISNALNIDWAKKTATKLGLISYLGFPIYYPDKNLFGTLCVANTIETYFTQAHEKLLAQFALVIENDLLHKETVKNDIKTRAILDHHYQMTGLLDINGKLIEANKKALEFISADISEVRDRYFWECPWWDSKQEQEVKDAFETAMTGKFVRIETTHLDSDNNRRFVDFSFNPVKDEKGKIIYVVPEGRDITERIDTFEVLRLTQEKLTKVFNSSPLPISITTLPEGRYIDVNPELVKLSEYTHNEIIGNTIHELGFYEKPEDHNKLIEYLETNGNLKNYQINFKTKSGKIRFCRLFSEIIEIRKEPCLLSIVYDDTDIIKAEMAEEESRQRYKNLLELLPEAVFETDNKLNIKYGNKQALRLFGYSEEDLLNGMNVLEVLTPEHRKIALEYDKKRLLGEDPGPIEYIALRKDGTRFPVISHAVSLMRNGKRTGLLGIIFDITDRKNTETRIQESEKKFRTVFESANDGILILKDNKIVECNSKGLSIFGFNDRHEIIGLSPTELSPKKQPDGRYTRTHEKENLLKVVRGNPQRFYWKHCRKDGSLFDAEISLNKIILNDEMHIQAIVRDITDRIIAKQKLKESEARFKRLFEDLGDAVYVTTLGGDNIGQILEANRAAVSQTGYSKSQLLKMNIINDLYVPGTGNIDMEEWENKTSNGEIITSVEQKKRKDGTVYWTEVLITPIVFLGQNACLSINRDITARIKSEQDLKLALKKAEESDQLKSAFLASMSHEIRTPLNAIIGFSTIIAEAVNDPELSDFSTMMIKQNDLLLKLVNDILEFAKIESGSLEISYEKFDISELIDDLHYEIKKDIDPGIEFITKTDKDKLIVDSDRDRIKQVYENLILNSLKFTRTGSVSFGFKSSENSELICFVKDTGIGIPKEQQKNIFDRFVKLDVFSQGTGLGLPISKNIIELLGGKIWVESKPEIGSEFYFKFPIER